MFKFFFFREPADDSENYGLPKNESVFKPKNSLNPEKKRTNPGCMLFPWKWGRPTEAKPAHVSNSKVKRREREGRGREKERRQRKEDSKEEGS